MSEEKKCLNNGELPEGVTELSMEDLEQVTGGVDMFDFDLCPPFYTGVKKTVDTKGRVDKFKERYF